MTRVREFIASRPILSLSVASFVALLLGVGIGLADSSQVVELEDEVADLEDDLADAETDLEGTADDLEEAEGQLSRAVTKARTAESKAKQSAEQELATEEQQLREQSQEVAQREADVSAAEQTLESSTIPDGIWQLGRDYEAGTYRAPGGGGCYWALLGSADTSDIINNGGFSQNQTITIDSPYFETSDCGEWVKLG